MGTGLHWWVADAWQQGPIHLFSWVVWVIGSIVLHELAHGWTAMRLGDRTPAETGHMTWNPVVHMGQMSLIVFAVMGIAWGMMPVNYSRMRGRHADAMVAAAGPVMNLWLFAFALGGAAVTIMMAEPLGQVAYPLSVFFITGAWLNIALAMFNLLPVPPLDGSTVLGSFFPGFAHLWRSEQGTPVGLIAFALVFYFGSSYIFDGAMHITLQALVTVLSLLGHAGGPTPAT
jgi:Zn-dependent protease